MEFDPPLVPATLLRRYKRFLADVTLADGTAVTVHCPNPGRMIGVGAPSDRIWLSPAPGRTLPFRWQLTELAGGHLAGIDTGIPNRLVGAALRAGTLGAFAAWQGVRAEVAYDTGSRIDFLLEGDGPPLFLEVKNVHLRRVGTLAEFPDCVTARGARHLGALARQVAAGARAALLYVVQRTDCDHVALAADLDPAYAVAAAEAAAAGVGFHAVGTAITTRGITITRPLPVAAPVPIFLAARGALRE